MLYIVRQSISPSVAVVQVTIKLYFLFTEWLPVLERAASSACHL